MKTIAKIIGVLIALLVVAGIAERVAPEPMAAGQVSLQRKISGLELKQVQIAGFDVPYLEGGPSDGVPLVLVHGFGADKDNFDRLAMFITPTMRVIALDVPGFGESSKPMDADYSIGAQVERLDQFLTALSIKRAHFGGSSMGGWIVGSYTAAHPDKVASLMLIDTAGVASAKTSEVRAAFEKTGEIKLVAKTPEDFDLIFNVVMSKPPYLPYSVKHVLAQRAAANYELHARIFQGLAKDYQQYTLESKLKGSNVPTLIVWGDEDRATDVSSVEILRNLLPNSKTLVLPGVGHLPHLEDPYPVAKAYKEFRAGL